jgi:mRNA interferase HigB
MRVIARRALREFWGRHPDAEQPLKIWFKAARTAKWRSPQDIKDLYRSASVLKDGRVVFNIAGNKYRLVVQINYDYAVLYIRFIGTHRDYDSIDVQEV